MWKKFHNQLFARVGLTLLTTLLLILFFGSWLWPFSPHEIMSTTMLLPPTHQHWLGSDELGRDLLARILEGGRISLLVSGFAALVTIVLGMTLGFASGYYGGYVDKCLSAFANFLISVPALAILLALTGIIGQSKSPQASIEFLVITIAALSWMECFRMVRSAVILLKQQSFVLSARVLGFSDPHIALFYIFPHCLHILAVFAPLAVSNALLIESALSFFGLGISPPASSWGSMLNEGRGILRTAPWVALFPGAAIAVTALAFNLLGEALRDASDPYQLGRA